MVTRLHRDRATVYRDGEGERTPPSMVFSNIPCKVSFGSGSVLVESKTIASADYSPTVFFAPGTTILEGDLIKITMFDGTSFEFIAGSVRPYSLNVAVKAKEEVMS